MRVGVYTDYVYRQDGDGIYGERAFVTFLFELANSAERFVIAGRLNPRPGRSHYRLPAGIEFVGLPYYESLTQPVDMVVSLARSIRTVWRMLDTVDVFWVLGPHPPSFLLVGLAALRRKRVVLGVRQDFPQYVGNRHPGRRAMHASAQGLELAFRLLAKVFPVVVVGPDLARRYRRAPRLLPVAISLVRETDVVERAPERDYEEDRRILSVGRLDREKNPVLLADVLARLRARDPRWSLLVCGEGPLREDLERRIHELGLTDHAQLLGYLPVDGALGELYGSSHAFLHVSWTEGLPQVLFESFAAGLPVVATDVGGVRAAAGDAALLVPPGDADAAARALERIADDAPLRARLQRTGLARAKELSLESQAAAVARFLREPVPGGRLDAAAVPSGSRSS